MLVKITYIDGIDEDFVVLMARVMVMVRVVLLMLRVMTRMVLMMTLCWMGRSCDQRRRSTWVHCRASFLLMGARCAWPCCFRWGTRDEGCTGRLAWHVCGEVLRLYLCTGQHLYLCVNVGACACGRYLHAHVQLLFMHRGSAAVRRFRRCTCVYLSNA